MFEVEAKVRVPDADAALAVLAARGVVFRGPVSQIDRIFAAARSDVLAPKRGTRILRVRLQEGAGLLTLKVTGRNELDCVELETGVSEPAQAIEMIRMLGYCEITQITKKRWTATTDSSTLCVDEVAELGSFVEIEQMHHESPPREVQGLLLRLLTSWLGPAAVPVHVGYDRLRLMNEPEAPHR